MQNGKSETGRYLELFKNKFHGNNVQRKNASDWIKLTGASQNNLKNIDVSIPLGVLTCVTGVSGSGKSSLVTKTLYPALARLINMTDDVPGKFECLTGIENIDRIISISQQPIGRTPRSNPATYTGLFDDIRNLFASLDESREKGYKQNKFSFNSKEGQCEACGGEGRRCIEMHFMPDVWVECPVCRGKRFNNEVLEINYNGVTIADVLDMNVEEALEFFKSNKRIENVLKTLFDVGLGYIKLGQSALTFSGGEAQRIKLARELSRESTGRTIYLLDEPTTGLHHVDIQNLLMILRRITESGNTVLVIEHNLEVIKSADWIIDLGPEGGNAGGYVMAQGTPENVVKVCESHTGQCLKEYLNP
jgi:excinuclease ABC subunit A